MRVKSGFAGVIGGGRDETLLGWDYRKEEHRGAIACRMTGSNRGPTLTETPGKGGTAATSTLAW